MIQRQRVIQDTPDSIINKDHTYNTGTFKTYFKNLNFKDHKRPIFKRLINSQLLTEWQAVEVLTDDYFLLVAVLKFSVLNKSLFLLYDRNNDILHDFSSSSKFLHKSHVSKSLENKNTSLRQTHTTSIEITNELEKNKLYIKGYGHKKDISMLFDIDFDTVSEPSVFVFPMTNKHTVYTEKDFLSCNGTIQVNGQNHHLNRHSIGILDDHRGYYPLSSGYDWLACMGAIDYKHRLLKFSLNLTDFYKNEDKEKYSENGYFLEGKFIHLGEVNFTRNGTSWTIKDLEGKVDLTFTNKQESKHIKKHIIKIDYLLSIGSITGTLTLYDGTVVRISNMFALGEKRVTQLLNQDIY